MYFFSHLLISKVLYRHFSTAVTLNKGSFSYGNILPDLPSQSRSHHTLENCLFKVCDSSRKLMEEELAIKDFSVRLGEICHYICDFFCYYHLSENIHNKRLHHFFYELGLHYKLLHLYHSRRISLAPSCNKPQRDISYIIIEMRKLYFSLNPGMKRDIDYAFLSSVWACESIIYYMKYPSNLAGQDSFISDFCSLLTAEGKSL